MPPRVWAGSVHVPDAVQVPLPTLAFKVLFVRSCAPVNVARLAESLKSDNANWATVSAPPALVCLTTCEAPPVAEKSVVPPGSVIVVLPATAAAFSVVAPDVDPERIACRPIPISLIAFVPPISAVFAVNGFSAPDELITHRPTPAVAKPSALALLRNIPLSELPEDENEYVGAAAVASGPSTGDTTAPPL